MSSSTVSIVQTARTLGLMTAKRAAGFVTRLLPIPQPSLLVGPDSSLRLAEAIGDFGHRKILFVTDAVVTKLGLARPMIEALEARGSKVAVFDQVLPDAPIPVIEEGIARFEAEHCDAIVAFGGGSVMDAAKVIGLAAANGRHPRDLVGYFRGRRGPAPLYAVPTTAGTGSEVTVAAVISDPEQHRKYVVADTRIVPRMAALDPKLMVGLPPEITAATGMDALTHAVEAFIGLWGTPTTDRLALSATSMVFEYLPRAYDRGDDLEAREKMALAATYAGMAFTRANVGYVHAIAHQLGGLYHTPHGLANAIVLPHVLRALLPQAAPKLAVLAERVGRAGRKTKLEDRALAFIKAVEAMNERLGIPRTLAALRAEDIPALARAAAHEADFNYPVPRVLSLEEIEAILRALLPDAAPTARAGTRTRRRSAQTPGTYSALP
jgi:alcohol dehydrogenase class IV